MSIFTETAKLPLRIEQVVEAEVGRDSAGDRTLLALAHVAIDGAQILSDDEQRPVTLRNESRR